MQPAAGEFFDILVSINIFLPLKIHVFQRQIKWEIPKISGLRPDPETPENIPEFFRPLKTPENTPDFFRPQKYDIV